MNSSIQNIFLFFFNIILLHNLKFVKNSLDTQTIYNYGTYLQHIGCVRVIGTCNLIAVNQYFGFGLLNATAMIQMAKNWIHVEKQNKVTISK